MDITKEKRRKKAFDYSLLILCVIFFVGMIKAVVYEPSEYNGFRIDDCVRIKETLEVSWGDNKINTTLPATIENNDAQPIYINMVLHKDELWNGNSILFRSRQSRAEVYLDDELIYDSGEAFNNPFPMGYGSLFKIVRIGDDYEGKVLTIKLEPGYKMKDVTGYVPGVYWGEQASFMKMIIKNTLLSLLPSLILIAVGIYYIVYGLFAMYKEKADQMIFLGLFSVDAGVWMLIECHILDLFISNMQMDIYFSYITYGMMPVLFVRFMLSYKEFFNKLYLNILFWLGVVMNLTQIILALAKIQSMFESQWINRCYLGLTVIGLIVALISVRKLENQSERKPVYAGILIIIVSTILELAFFFLINKQNSGNILRYGICLFILKEGIDLIKEGRMLGKEFLEKELLQAMAYTDGMTHLGNRFSYEKEKERLENMQDTGIIMLIADMNGLKQANDNYGHTYGDQVICKTAEILRNSFSEIAKCFRIGGDEFLVLAENVNREDFDKCVEMMNKAAQELNSSIDSYGIASGVAQGVASDIDDIFHEADNLMYQCKKKIKERKTM